MSEVIPFPKMHQNVNIDWDRVDSIRKAGYPKVPKKAITLIRKMFENPTGNESYFEIHDFGEGYPFDPISLAPVQGDALWLLDLLDRYGGEISYGPQTCLIKRKKKKPALFLIQKISAELLEAVHAAIGPEYEHFLQTSRWVVLGREVNEKLMIFVIRNREDEALVYLGVFDRKTAFVLFARMESGRSVEEVLDL